MSPFSLHTQDEGRYLAIEIRPEALPDACCTTEMLLEFLLETGFSSFEYALDNQALESLAALDWEHQHEPVISRLAQRIEFDLRVTFSPDEMQATLTLKRAFPEEQISPTRLRERLALLGVQAGIDEVQLEKIATEGEALACIIAQGKKPVAGTDADLERLTETISRDHLPFVSEGSPLLRWHPPSPGIEGYTVKGKPLAASPGQEILLRPGEGSDFSENDLRVLIAKRAGVPIWGEETVRVEALHYYQLEELTAEQRFEHNIVLQGQAQDAISVTASGHIWLQGHLAPGSSLFAGGDLIMSPAQAGPLRLECGGDLHCGDLREAIVWVGNQLRLEGCLDQCQIFACGPLVAEQGQIVGGRLLLLSGGELQQMGTADTPSYLEWNTVFFEQRLALNQVLLERTRTQWKLLLQARLRAQAQGAKRKAQELKQFQQQLHHDEINLEQQINRLKRQLQQHQATFSLHQGQNLEIKRGTEHVHEKQLRQYQWQKPLLT